MVDPGTWNRLSPEEQNEFNALRQRFIAAVTSSGLLSGWGEKYKVASQDNAFFLSDGGAPFAGITSKSRAVIEALHTNAIQNYNR